MKKSSLSTFDQPRSRHPRGFALVATLLLMVLLSLLAVGMLTLSTVTIRSSSRLDSMAEARANAKMALMIAIGELQKEMGPDKRISATSDIYGTETAPVSKPNLVGVWDSWDPLSEVDRTSPENFSPPDYAEAKTNRDPDLGTNGFRRWLVSSPNNVAIQDRDFVRNDDWLSEDGQPIETIELVGARTLGIAPASVRPEDTVVAGLIPVSQGDKVRGSYAWHVADESVKARINLYRDPLTNPNLAEQRSLLAGHRPDPSVITDSAGNLVLVDNGTSILPTDHTQETFVTAKASVGKVIDLNQAELLDGAEGLIKPLRNVVTPYSLGVMSDVRNGGLKQDLSSAFEMGSANSNRVPAEFTNERLYDSTHGITGVSDPKWSALAGYYNSYRNLTDPENNPLYSAGLGTTVTDVIPSGYNPAPVIARVDTIFSLIVRPLDQMAFWISNPAGPTVQAWDYIPNLIYTPVVVLHNPYNVSISFHKMEVAFKNVPVAFNFMFQPGEGGPFVSRSVVEGDFDSINNMVNNANRGRGEKIFTVSIANWSDDNPLPDNDSIDGSIVLKPGQSLICGPVFPENSNYDQDTKIGNNAVGQDWAWDTERTIGIKSKPGLYTGLGFETNSITIAASRSARNAALPRINTGVMKPNGTEYVFIAGAWDNQSAMPLRDVNDPNGSPATVTDRFYVEYKLQRPQYYATDSAATPTPLPAEFTVTAQIQSDENSELVNFANLNFVYENDNTLRSAIEDRVYRYPPDPGNTLAGAAIAAPSGVTYRDQGLYVQPLAAFSGYARTTNGGVYETGVRTEAQGNSSEINLLRDGRLAGKPFLFHNPTRSNFTMNLANVKPGVQSHELNFQPFLSPGDFEDYMDVDQNRVPSLMGNQSNTGIKSGSYLEVPSGPLQTIADFRRSNALATSYLPHFVQPVGNSLLHPLMSPNQVIETDAAVSPNALLDHSFLANHALYDRFYFSTFASKGILTPDTVFEQFMDGTASLASQAFQPYLPIGQTVADARSELFGRGKPRDTAYQQAAEYQMIRGPFNVNSTSVQAWKAVLASLNETAVPTFGPSDNEVTTHLPDGIPIPSMSLSNGRSFLTSEASDASALDSTSKSEIWDGYPSLTNDQIETLARSIVDEVRERGPFLSMSEFVNRQIGPNSALTRSGALEAAIAAAEINEPVGASSSTSFLNQVPIATSDVSDPNLYAYNTPEATTGNPAAGVPGWVNQADLLRILGPSATVRGDTFVIRVYGEAQDVTGNVTARAYAEAVVQRIPDYVDSADRPSVNAADPSSGAAVTNQAFGRRMNVTSFRWLSENEI